MYLLDSHILLWFHEDSPRLDRRAFAIIEDASQRCFVSAATAWEIAIKQRVGKLSLDVSIPNLVRRQLMELLPISLEHVEETKNLPFHHRDPFDRMLVAQARVEGLTLITNDKAIQAYEVETLW